MSNVVLPQNRFTAEELENTPVLGRPFQYRTQRLLVGGQVTIQTGYVTDESGHTTTYAAVRPLAFEDPSYPYRTGLVPHDSGRFLPFGFRSGSVLVSPPRYKVLLLSGSPAHNWFGGHVSVTMGSDLGALTEFSIWSGSNEDPRDFYVDSATNLTDFGTGQPWVRMSAVFVPHRNTRYLGVGSKIYALTHTGGYRTHYFKKWMLEHAPLGNTLPTPSYRKAREVVTVVRPDRVNYIRNPSFEVNTTHWLPDQGAPTLAVSTDQAKYGAHSLLLTSTAANSDLGAGQDISVALPPDTWTLSWWAWSPIDRQAYADVTWSGGSALGSGNKTLIPANTWTRVWCTFTLDDLKTPMVYLHHVAGASQAPGATMYIDGVMLERTAELREYFDGSTSSDTIWELGSNTGLGRSYLYKNREERYAAMIKALEDNVPFGIGIAPPVMGTLPVD